MISRSRKPCCGPCEPIRGRRRFYRGKIALGISPQGVFPMSKAASMAEALARNSGLMKLAEDLVLRDLTSRGFLKTADEGDDASEPWNDAAKPAGQKPKDPPWVN